MLFQYIDNPERSSNLKMNSCCDSETQSDSFSENCVVDFIKAESSSKIETHKENRNEIYFVKSDNRKDDILCGCMFILMSHSNEFIMVVNLKSEVK